MYLVGIDVASQDVTAACLAPTLIGGAVTFAVIWQGRTFTQDEAGWRDLAAAIPSDQEAVIIMEATGVYSERIAAHLFQRGLAVHVEPPGKVKLAFYERGKTDTVDARQLAEYAFRFSDRLHPWQPRAAVVEQLAALLTSRDMLTRNRTAHLNLMKAFQRKPDDMTAILTTQHALVAQLDEELDGMRDTMTRLIATNPQMQTQVAHLLSIPNIGLLLAVELLILTNGFTAHLRYQELASYCGICPFEYSSGSSVYRAPKGDNAGPARMRKLLYLAAMRMRRNHPGMRRYFERKVAEGKPPRLALRNLENKCLKLMCGVVNSGKPYIDGYRSRPSFS